MEIVDLTAPHRTYFTETNYIELPRDTEYTSSGVMETRDSIGLILFYFCC